MAEDKLHRFTHQYALETTFLASLCAVQNYTSYYSQARSVRQGSLWDVTTEIIRPYGRPNTASNHMTVLILKGESTTNHCGAVEHRRNRSPLLGPHRRRSTPRTRHSQHQMQRLLKPNMQHTAASLKHKSTYQPRTFYGLWRRATGVGNPGFRIIYPQISAPTPLHQGSSG